MAGRGFGRGQLKLDNFVIGGEGIVYDTPSPGTPGPAQGGGRGRGYGRGQYRQFPQRQKEPEPLLIAAIQPEKSRNPKKISSGIIERFTAETEDKKPEKPIQKSSKSSKSRSEKESESGSKLTPPRMIWIGDSTQTCFLPFPYEPPKEAKAEAVGIEPEAVAIDPGTLYDQVAEYDPDEDEEAAYAAQEREMESLNRQIAAEGRGTPMFWATADSPMLFPGLSKDSLKAFAKGPKNSVTFKLGLNSPPLTRIITEDNTELVYLEKVFKPGKIRPGQGMSTEFTLKKPADFGESTNMIEEGTGLNNFFEGLHKFNQSLINKNKNRHEANAQREETRRKAETHRKDETDRKDETRRKDETDRSDQHRRRGRPQRK